MAYPATLQGVGMRWSKDGFNYLFASSIGVVNQRFDSLFSDESLILTLYPPTARVRPANPTQVSSKHKKMRC